MIRAYSIKHFYECKITGRCLAEIQFQNGNEYNVCMPSFSNRENAMAYIDKESREWFLEALERWTNHKAHINEKHAEMKSKLDTCREALAAYKKNDLKTICHRFSTKGYIVFMRILPYPLNDSFASSENDLKELKSFCEEYLKFNPIKQ
jgi:hypothetical protein